MVGSCSSGERSRDLGRDQPIIGCNNVSFEGGSDHWASVNGCACSPNAGVARTRGPFISGRQCEVSDGATVDSPCVAEGMAERSASRSGAYHAIGRRCRRLPRPVPHLTSSESGTVYIVVECGTRRLAEISVRLA